MDGNNLCLASSWSCDKIQIQFNQEGSKSIIIVQVAS